MICVFELAIIYACKSIIQKVSDVHGYNKMIFNFPSQYFF